MQAESRCRPIVHPNSAELLAASRSLRPSSHHQPGTYHPNSFVSLSLGAKREQPQGPGYRVGFWYFPPHINSAVGTLDSMLPLTFTLLEVIPTPSYHSYRRPRTRKTEYPSRAGCCCCKSCCCTTPRNERAGRSGSERTLLSQVHLLTKSVKKKNEAKNPSARLTYLPRE